MLRFHPAKDKSLKEPNLTEHGFSSKNPAQLFRKFNAVGSSNGEASNA